MVYLYFYNKRYARRRAAMLAQVNDSFSSFEVKTQNIKEMELRGDGAPSDSVMSLR